MGTDLLRVTAGPAAGTEIDPGEELLIGRSAVGEGRLGDDPEISRRHAKIRRDGPGLLIQDLGSTNGSFVNGRPVTDPQPLRSGDVVTVGTTTLEVQGVLGATLATPRPPARPPPTPPPPTPPPPPPPTPPPVRRAPPRPGGTPVQAPAPPRPESRSPAAARRPSRRTRALILIGVAALALVLASELVLPGLAERRLREQLAENGTPERVSVSATPALELAARRADAVEVRLASYGSGLDHLADMVADAGKTDRLDATAAKLRVSSLALTDARLTKRGERLSVQALVSDSDLRKAAPGNLDLRPVASDDGDIVLRGTLGVLGVQASGRARVLTRDGRIVIEPEDIPFGDFAAISVFADRRIAVTRVRAVRSPGGLRISAEARLR